MRFSRGLGVNATVHSKNERQFWQFKPFDNLDNLDCIALITFYLLIYLMIIIWCLLKRRLHLENRFDKSEKAENYQTNLVVIKPKSNNKMWFYVKSLIRIILKPIKFVITCVVCPHSRHTVHTFREPFYNWQINKMVNAMHLPDNVVDRAHQLFSQVHNKSALSFQSIPAISCACLYLMCQREGVPIDLKRLSAVSKTWEQNIVKCYDLIIQLMRICDDLVINYGDFSERFCSKLGLWPWVEEAALGIAQNAIMLDCFKKEGGASVAAAAIFIATQASVRKISMKNIGEAIGVSEASIRTVYKLMQSYQELLCPTHFEIITPP